MPPVFLTYNALASLADVAFDVDDNLRLPDAAPIVHDARQLPGSVRRIFVKNDLVATFVLHVLPVLDADRRLVLLLGAGDVTPPVWAVDAIARDERIVRVFATNWPMAWNGRCPKVAHVPIGFPEPCRATGPQRSFASWYTATYAGVGDAEELRERLMQRKRWRLLVPPMQGTHPDRSRLLLNAHNWRDTCDIVAGPLEHADYMKMLSVFAACIVPRGNGLDVHRVVECVLVGTLPIYVASASEGPPGIVGALGLPWIPIDNYGRVPAVPTAKDAARILWRARAALFTSSWAAQMV